MLAVGAVGVTGRYHAHDAASRPRRGLPHLGPARRRLRRRDVLLHRTGEPPGQWAGKGAAALGLTGQVDPAVIGRLYQHNIGPGGELLVKRRQSGAADEREEATVAAYRAAHPYASATELAEVRAAERERTQTRCRIST